MEDRQFYFFFKEEMIANGFNIVAERSNAKYLLDFQVGSKTSKVDSVRYLPSSSRTSGQIGDTLYSEATDSTQAIPYSYNYTVKKVWFKLYAVEDIKKENFMTAWEGYIGAEEKVYEENTRGILRNLFDVFGANYKAHTPN